MLERLKVWLAALRVKFFLAGIPPVVLGFLVAYYETGLFDAWLFTLTLIGIIAAMAGCYTFNEYYDYRSGVDVVIKPEHVTPFNAGSRVLPSGLLRPRDIFLAGSIAWVVMVLIGLYLAMLRGALILVLMILGTIAALGYTTPPMKWAYRGLGELLIGISYGPIITLGSYAVQTGTLGLQPLIASIMPGFLITNVIWINEFPDYEADRACGKKNLIVRLGRERASKIYVALFVFAYISVVASIAAGAMPPYCMLSLITIPLAVRASLLALKNHGSPLELVPAMRDTVAIFVASTILLSAGYVLPRLI
jgi:1,4-dihydroxy-2-naphthoate octaprenyltransferase